MRTLKTLIKLQKTRVDEQRQILAKLQDALSLIEERMMQLEIDMAREQVVAQENEEARESLGAYLKACVQKARDLEKQRHAAIIAVDEAREGLIQLFEEQKRYEIALTAQEAEQLAEEKHNERLELDEIGGTRHARQTKD